MRRLMLVGCLSLGVLSLVSAGPLAPTSRLLAQRWRCSTKATAGWNAPGYNAAQWVPVTCDLPAAYPAWMTPELQARHRVMWHPGGANRMHPVYFRRTLTLDGKPAAASLRVCADDRFRLFVNGRLVGGEAECMRTGEFDVTSFLRAGANVIGVEAVDTKPWGYGLLVVGEVTQAWTDKSAWRCQRRAFGQWKASGFDDHLWPRAVVDRAPDIAVEGKSYGCLTTPTDLGDYETAYFRRRLSLDGLPVSGNLTVLGDDSYELYVNAKLTALEKRPELAYHPVTLDIGDRLHSGHNAIAVKITNVWGPARLYCVPTATIEF